MLNITHGMYILFEKSDSKSSDELYNYDCMGYAHTEQAAMEWRDGNPESRTYKYCSNVCIDNNIHT